MADNWKDTLNLPKTSFPMRANLPNREPQTLERWEEMGLYQRIMDARKDGPRFAFHDGPPYANGHIHHGHILNKILKDIACKFKAMTGHLAEFIPGWDCHGLPIEHEVDKKLRSKKREMDQVAIREVCRDYANRFVAIQRDEFKRIGVLADWDNPYTTLDRYYESTVVGELANLIEKGLVFKALRPIHWSYAAQTALAEAEVEYKEYTAPSIYVKFPFPDAPSFLADPAGDRPISAVIWTTTPWTLPANLAIALHPDFDYLLVDVDGDALILAEGLAPSVYEACGLSVREVIKTFKGSELVGTEHAALKPAARHPFIDRESILLPADYVTLEQGTGCVHTAPGHGQEDFVLGREHGLGVLSPVNEYGKYTDAVPEYEGQHVFKANPLIVERLHEIGALLNKPGDSVLIERYPHCWRTKKPVIFRATPQWFVKVDQDQLRDRALQAIKTTEWIPGWGEDRIRGMLEHRPDWCISRQRTWGVPIPGLYCQSCGEVTLSHEVARKLAKISEDEGVDAWFRRPVEELVPDGFACQCGAGVDQFTKESDIIDVWFESGASFAAVLERRGGLEPVADLYLEGSDQHRGWFQSSLLIGIGSRNHAPYRTVLTHGFVIDEQGHKYSKSSKNFEPPSKVINKLGAEVMRLWVAAVDYRTDITLSPTILQRMTDAYRRIRNTARFLVSNLSDFDPNKDAVSLDTLPDLDTWALDKLASLTDRLLKAYEDYEYHAVFHRLLDFCTVDLSQSYLDVLKDRLYCEAPNDPRRRASQTVMYEALRAITLLSAPVLSFTAEELWGHMPHRDGDPESVHLALLPSAAPAEWSAEGQRERFELLHKVRSKVQEAIEARRPKSKGERLPGQIGSSQEAVVTIRANGSALETLSKDVELLKELFIVSDVRLEEGEMEDNVPEVSVDIAEGEKCPRCWNYRSAFGVDGQHSEVCQRCAGVVISLATQAGNS